MKTQFLLLSVVLIFTSLLGCEKNTTDIATSSDAYTKQITALDASGRYSIKLKLYAMDQSLLQSYTDQSFALTFEKSAAGTPESTSLSDVTALPESINNALTIEIVETALPANTPFLLTLNKNSALNSGAKLAARMVTVTLVTAAPYNYIDIYNKSSSSMSVSFSYSTTSSSSGFVSAGTKTASPRTSVSYCRIGIKGLRASVTYDANAGTYSYFVWQKYSC